MRKNILLIGGTKGIGLEIVKELSPDHNIIVASRSDENLSDYDVTHHIFDALTDDISELDLPDTLDGFVYCPGSINLKPFKMMKPEIFEQDMQINFMSLMKATHGVISKLKNSKQASIVYFSTVAVQTGLPYHTSVAAAKGAIEGFARSLAAEYAPLFRVNVIAPSLVNTPLANKLLGNDKKKEKMDERHPLKRVGEPSDIGKMASFLLSDNSTWMTGQVIGVDGGMGSLNVS
ncbi:beta-ketoacyl acyl carrier protein (ACP) reductase, putative FabG [Psychroflexus torquis ATCC 700755]|uniref:Beta-ketoacyl acyl carrier protein (ACP) reductase, putative FabG n=1 Tax=Psychroflexus torquis (strain ATCC 700755 / CIP 106069 / ACAM 623) TaxID=313595 RepID=K4IVY5_PSYTT|nr:SDR family oxidoreductase [Psychroflexus torquis]AFU69620.1 beta-ketoacyl acyl carrier protein (ACP) reductase, putative FabG [Psychroflexus torquis ATCC 700755]